MNLLRRLAIPLVVVAVPLQAQSGTFLTPGLPRTSVTLGVSGLRGEFETSSDSADLRVYTAKHVHLVGGAMVELRHERLSGFGAGLRLSAFAGNDRSPASTQYVRPGFSLPPSRESWDTARVDEIRGFSGAASVDSRYVGLIAGIVAGTWPRRTDYPITGRPDQSRIEPLAELRIGRVTGWRAELATHAQWPAPAPGPMYRAGFAHTGAKTGHTYSFGGTNDGVYVGARWMDRKGTELEPFVSVLGPTRRQFGLAIRQQLDVGR